MAMPLGSYVDLTFPTYCTITDMLWILMRVFQDPQNGTLNTKSKRSKIKPYKGLSRFGFQNMAFGRINEAAALTGFSYKKMYGHFAGTK